MQQLDFVYATLDLFKQAVAKYLVVLLLQIAQALEQQFKQLFQIHNVYVIMDLLLFPLVLLLQLLVFALLHLVY